jgi:HEAT repeat protein
MRIQGKWGTALAVILAVLFIVILAFLLLNNSSEKPAEENVPAPPSAELTKLIRELGDPTPMVAAEAAVKLGGMGDTAAPAASALVALLGSRNDFYFDGPDAQGRMSGGMISPRQDARAALLAAVGTAAAGLLGEIGDPRALEPLRKAATAGRSGVWEAAAAASEKIEKK